MGVNQNSDHGPLHRSACYLSVHLNPNPQPVHVVVPFCSTGVEERGPDACLQRLSGPRVLPFSAIMT